MYWTVKSVTPLANYWLHLTFENGEQRYFDMKPLLDTGVFKALRDTEMFCTVRVAFDSIAWNNEIDIAPETLYHNGLIQIPEQLANENISNVRVILLADTAKKVSEPRKSKFSAMRLKTKGFTFNREDLQER
jgi:hypothetical protein